MRIPPQEGAYGVGEPEDVSVGQGPIGVCLYTSESAAVYFPLLDRPPFSIRCLSE